MQKEEILRMAQAEGEDERELQIKDKSMICSYMVMMIVATIFSFIRQQQGLPMMDLSATVCVSVVAGMIYCYIKTRDKGNVVIAVIALCIAVLATICFFMGH